MRTGDTPQAERNAMRKRVPHILVTTPESLYVLLGSASGREMLADVQSVIVDEIHAVAGNKRGCHLALTLEWIGRARPAKAIITNMHLDMDYATLEAELPPHIRPAFDGMVLSFDNIA